MLTRREIKQQQREAKEKKSSKASAAERTLPLFKDKEPDILVTCTECEEEVNIKELTQRGDGAYECSSCAAPIRLDKKTKGKEKKLEIAPVSSQLDKQEGENRSHSGMYCAECGTSWPLVNGKVWPNCGHENKGVDDPKKAKTINPPAGHQRKPQVVRVMVSWSEAMFRVADYCYFRVGPFTDEATVRPDEDPDEVRLRLRNGLMKLADDTFEKTFDWYMEKLGIVHKKVTGGKKDKG